MGTNNSYPEEEYDHILTEWHSLDTLDHIPGSPLLLQRRRTLPNCPSSKDSASLPDSYAEQYEESFPNYQLFRKRYQPIYNNRTATSPYLVHILNWVGKNDHDPLSKCCCSEFSIIVLTERIPYRLSEVTQATRSSLKRTDPARKRVNWNYADTAKLPSLSFDEGVYVLVNTLHAFQLLANYDMFPYPTSNNIGFNSQGEVKTWANQKWSCNDIYLKQNSQVVVIEELLQLISHRVQDTHFDTIRLKKQELSAPITYQKMQNLLRNYAVDYYKGKLSLARKIKHELNPSDESNYKPLERTQPERPFEVQSRSKSQGAKYKLSQKSITITYSNKYQPYQSKPCSLDKFPPRTTTFSPSKPVPPSHPSTPSHLATLNHPLSPSPIHSHSLLYPNSSSPCHHPSPSQHPAPYPHHPSQHPAPYHHHPSQHPAPYHHHPPPVPSPNGVALGHRVIRKSNEHRDFSKLSPSSSPISNPSSSPFSIPNISSTTLFQKKRLMNREPGKAFPMSIISSDPVKTMENKNHYYPIPQRATWRKNEPMPSAFPNKESKKQANVASPKMEEKTAKDSKQSTQELKFESQEILKYSESASSSESSEMTREFKSILHSFKKQEEDDQQSEPQAEPEGQRQRDQQEIQKGVNVVKELKWGIATITEEIPEERQEEEDSSSFD